MPLSAGNRFGPYEILAKLGEGGMGEVYKARDTRLGRFVAIKVLPAEKLADPERQRRFQQEAISASALNHPNIITIYDFGTEDGVTFLVMELVAGRSLDQLIAPPGMKLGEILRIGSQIADALARAHSNGIVHRDLKPCNVMLTADGLVKVLDFGLAKLTQSAEAEADATRTMLVQTEIGSLVGTAPYMSPEQAEGKALDGRSDIFAFGSLLYEMATGSPAFRGDTAISTLWSILRDEPAPVEEVRRDLPPQLGRVIARCLRKEPARRFQHMADLKVELDELRQESESGKLSAATYHLRPSASRSLHTLASRAPIWIAAAAAAAAVGFVGYRYLTHPIPGTPLAQAAPSISQTATNPAPAASAESKPVAPAAATLPAVTESAPRQTTKPATTPTTTPTTTPSVLPAKKTDAALASSNEAEDSPLGPQTPEPRVPAEAKAAYDQGRLLVDQKKPADAIPFLDRAIRAHPNYLNAYLARAEARRLSSQYEMSMEDCNQALRISAQDARPHFCRGLGEALLKQYDLALRDYGDAIRINPDFANAYDSRANAYNNLQQYDHAIEDYTQALRLRPNNGQFYLRRAAVYEKLMQYEKAIRDYDQVIRLQPGNARGYTGRANAKKQSGDGRGAAQDRRIAHDLKEQ